MLQRGCDRDDLLNERNFEVICKRQTAGTRDDRGDLQIAEFFTRFTDEGGQCFLNIGIMSPVVGEKQLLLRRKDRDFDRRGADIDA